MEAVEVGKGGWKSCAKANLAAIRILKSHQQKYRHATPGDQAKLVKDGDRAGHRVRRTQDLI